MKTLNLSLNALIALCCSLWLMTSCQDDAVESDLLPASEAEDANQTSVPDDVLQLLHSVAENSPLEREANPNARTSQPFVFEYDFSLTVSERIRGGQPGEVRQELSGTLTLWAVDSTDLINNPSAQAYQGGYVAVDAQGDTIRRRAAALIGEGEDEGFLIVKNIPGAGDIVVGEGFEIMGDTAGEAIGSRDADGNPVFVTFESDFVEAEASIPSYELLVQVPAGTGRLATLRGTLELAPSERFTGSLEGTFTFVTNSGEEGVVSAGVFPPSNSDVTISLNFEDFQPLGGLAVFMVPAIAFERGVDSFVTDGEILRTEGNIDIRVGLTLLENESPS